MKRIIYLGVWLFTAINPLAATAWDVCEDCSIKHIKQAISTAMPGDTVIIHPGHYQEGNILIDKPLTILGHDFPVIDGNNETEVITVAADNVTIEGLQVQNVGTSYMEDRAGIRVRRSRNFIIAGNKLVNTFFGIYLEHSDAGTVAGNEVIGNAIHEMSSGNAIHVWYCDTITIEDNIVARHRDGIYLEFVYNSTVRGNLSEDNLRYGLHFMFSNEDSYYGNTFRRNGAGVAVMFSKNIDMFENNFELNWGKSSYGLLLKEIYDAEIRNNTFRLNSIAIYVEGSTRINYSSNHFASNGWAIKISGGCLDNIITGNNFVANTFDLSLNSNPNNNSFDGNYWSSYSGYDLDNDGTGDIPYRPVKLFNYVINKTPEAIVLLRSLFIDIVNFSERVSPVLTPANVVDTAPRMKMIPGAIAGNVK